MGTVLTVSDGTLTSILSCHCSAPLPGLAISSFEKGISVKLKAFKPGVAFAEIIDSVSSSVVNGGWESSSVFLQLVITSVLSAHAIIALLHRNITVRFVIEC